MSHLTRRLSADHLVLGPQVAGRRVYRQDGQRCIIIDGRLVHFSPGEYHVSVPLLRHRERWERGQAPPWTTSVALAAASGIAAALLHRSIMRASHKLTPSGIEFVRIRNPAHGDLYQTLVHERDILQEQEEQAHG